MISTRTSKRNQVSEDAILRVLGRLDSIVEGVTKIGVAYVGFKAANHWTGALTNLVALKLAQGGNVVAGAAGTAVLAISGLTQMQPQQDQPLLDYGTAMGEASWPYWLFGDPSQYQK